MIDARNNWLARLLSEKSDQDLRVLFAEINEYRETGLLKGTALRELEEYISKEYTKTRGGEMLRTVEDAVLFEMARRYYNTSVWEIVRLRYLNGTHLENNECC